jgi:hypothetical protein
MAQENKEVKKEEVKKVTYWKHTGLSSLNFSQSSFSNWSSGGENSIAGTTNGTLTMNYSKKKVSWENGLTMRYGLQYQGSKRSKTDDMIDSYSKFGYKAFGKVDYTAQVTFKTQFDKGYSKYPITEESLYNSKLMSPAYIVLSLGFDFKPNSEFSLVLSPVSGKFTIVLDDSLSHIGVYGVKPDRHAYYELGTYLKASYNKKIGSNITVKTALDVFSNLLRNPENADINWDISLLFMVTKYLSSSLNLQLRYDDDTKNTNADKGPALQTKQVLGLGLTYNF